MPMEEIEPVPKIYRKKSSTSSTSKKTHRTSFQRQRSMSASEDSSGDILSDLSALPTFNSSADRSRLRLRRHSEFQNNLIHNDRRNSAPQHTHLSFWSTIFRPTPKSHWKDESPIEPMAMKNELPSSAMKFVNPLAQSQDRLSPLIQDDSSSTTSTTTAFTFPSQLFTLATALAEPRSADSFILQLQCSPCLRKIYHEHFSNHFHTNYCGDLEHEGPFLLSLRCTPAEENQYQARALIRTSTRNFDLSMTMPSHSLDDHLLQNILQQANLSNIQLCKVIGDPRANEKIEAFDKLNEERQNCKVGLIYQRSNQKEEYDLFANDGLSEHLEGFLQFLGDKVRLKGFHRFRGDLDIKDDLHGHHSYYTEYDNHEIMFNIAPMIPSLKANGQCIERKGLVGNAFVCVVFQESDAEFHPEYISGKVTQVYITVQPTTIHDELYFKVGIWHRSDLSGIIDPPGGIVKFDASFRDYFLTLLLNALHVAIESPSLRTRVFEQRQRLKQEDLKKLIQTLTAFPNLDPLITFESINVPIDARLNSRADSFVNISSGSSNNENIPPPPSSLSSTGRISPVSAKKGRFQKIFGVFTSKSSIPTVSAPVALPPAPIPVESSVISNLSAEKDIVKRKPSVKGMHAPVRPNALPASSQSHRPIQPTQSIPLMHSPTLPSNKSDLPSPTELYGRHRSNSSPANGILQSHRSVPPVISAIDEEHHSTDRSLSNDFTTDDLPPVPSFELS